MDRGMNTPKKTCLNEYKKKLCMYIDISVALINSGFDRGGGGKQSKERPQEAG